MITAMFFVGLFIGAVLGFGFGILMLMPFVRQVSDLEDMLMSSKIDLNQMRDRLKVINDFSPKVP